MNKKIPSALVALFALVLLWLALIGGWVLNLIWLFTSDPDATTEFWIALAGTIVAPVGAVHGWITVF